MLRCALMLLVVMQWCCTTVGPPNPIAVYLSNAERQTETQDQREEVRRVLEDLLAKRPSEMRAMRYPDYSGEANRWSAIEVLRHYFVPAQPASLQENSFYEDVWDPRARAEIEKQLEAVRKSLKQ